MLEKTSTNKDGRTQIFFTPFRPKSLDCWEYVSRRFETVNLPHVLRELDLGICFNMIIFDILSLSWVQRCVAASTDKFSPHHSNGVKGKASGNRRHPGTSFEKIEIRERKERT